MGLDMYLEARRYVSGYEHTEPEEREQYQAAVKAADMEKAVDPHTPSATITVTVAYWRKANAIHKWFVDNVQDGEDDCDEYHVSREKLEELRDTCRKVLEIADISEGQPVHAGTTWRPGQEPEQHFKTGRAILNGKEVAEVLPTQGGFCFGATDYDEWYLQGVEETIEQLDRVLTNVNADGWRTSLYYRASW